VLRRTIAELLVRYELEPSLKDVFVEGPSDRTLVQLALKHCGAQERIQAYEIDTVEVPAVLLERRGLRDGNKGRLLALADELASRSGRDLQCSVVCLVDQDLDGVLGNRREYSLSLYTSSVSLDAVVATPEVIEKLLSVVLLGFPDSADGLLSQLLLVLRELFLCRVAAAEFRMSEGLPQFTKLCCFSGRKIEFRTQTFVRRYLEKAGRVDLEAAFQASMERHRAALRTNPCLHMEDFWALLHAYVRHVKPKLVPEFTRFRRFVFGLVDGAALASLPECREIVARLWREGMPSSG
jgi:hypothetical protein